MSVLNCPHLSRSVLLDSLWRFANCDSGLVNLSSSVRHDRDIDKDNYKDKDVSLPTAAVARSAAVGVGEEKEGV